MSANAKVLSAVSAKDIPFEKVKIVSFTFSADSREETAMKQYQLLLKPQILQVHIDFPTKKGMAVCLIDFDLEAALKDAGVSGKKTSEEIVTYKEYQRRNTMGARN